MSTETVFRARTRRPESPSLVDPRLQARRNDVARSEGRRRRRWIGLAVVVVLLVVGAFAVTQSPLLAVDAISVTGTGRARADAAREASGIAVGQPLISVDAPAAERRLEALPWVDEATVSRAWPGTVEVALVERTPTAVVGTGSAAVQVDRDGRVLGSADAGSDLPVVAGDPAPVGQELDPTARWVVSIVAGLPAALRSEVTAATATDSGVNLTLTDGITVRWGDRSQATAKADAVAVLLEQADRSTIAIIDVSVPRAATVTRS